MPFEYIIQDVSADFIMDVAKIVSSSPFPLKKENILKSFKRHVSYTNRAIIQAQQLKLVEDTEDGFTSTQNYGDSIKRALRNQYNIHFRQALQNYPPFLLYADFITKGYNSEESALFVKGILDLSPSEKMVEKSLKNWGKYAELIVENKGKLSIPDAERGLPSEFIDNLLNSLQVEFKTNIFLIETMGANTFAYLAKNGISIDNLVSSLQYFENESKQSANMASQVFEYFLYKISSENGIDISKCNGIGELTQALRPDKKISKNIMHVSNGLGAIRNMSHHDPDKETEVPWNFTPQGALITSLLVPTTMRTIYNYITEKKQEF